MLSLTFVWIVVSTFISTIATKYCPNATHLAPCRCPGPDVRNDIICNSKGHLNLTSIFDKIMKDPQVRSENYNWIQIDNDEIEEIPEKSLAKMNFEKIWIGKDCYSLRRIHSNAFEHQYNRTKYFNVFATNIFQDKSPYNFYDLVNSFHNLESLLYSSRIGILEEKLGVNLNKLNFLYLSVDAIKGSPFSNMRKIQVIDLSRGRINYITNSSFKLENTRRNARYNHVDFFLKNDTNIPLLIDLQFNKLNGSSFEKGTFTHQTLKNISISLELGHNQINFLNKQVFLPFLSSGINHLGLTNNPLDCDDCRSAWICESISVSNGKSMKQLEITQLIDVNARCSDNKRSFFDCENNFSGCESFESNESTSMSMNENCQTQIIIIILVSSALTLAMSL